jgi:HK97 family phage prohead protease
MSRIHKVHSATITSVKGKTVRALVSTWDIVDFQGDRVRRGAFLNSIREWEESGDKLPFLWSHQWLDPMAHLGVVQSMRETDRGLEVTAEILDDNEFAQQVKRLIEQRRVTQYSFAYDVVRERMMEDGSNELLELKLIEAGPTLSGANPYTDTLSRKAVQAMLAREASGEPTWAGTSVPQKAVDDLRSRMSGMVESFLDELYEAEVNMTPQKTTDPEIQRLNAELDKIVGSTPSTDADLIRQIDELSGKGLVISADYAGVLTRASTLLAQSAVRAQVAGLVDAEVLLMAASHDLRTIASGGEGNVEDVIAACRPLVAELRTVNPVAGDSLERTLAELAGGMGVPYVENSDRVEGSVGVTDNVVSDRDRYEPKAVIDGRVDARMRPLNGPAAAVPVDTGETYHFPVVTTDPESYRVEKEDA